MVEHPKVVALFTKEVEDHSAAFKGFERVKKVRVLADDFTVENGMLTPKMSLKRRVVLQKYGDVLNAMY